MSEAALAQTADGANDVDDVLLSVRGLQIKFQRGGPPAQALRGVDFDIRRGETVALVGEFGSGKSATALALVGLLPRSGQISAGSIVFQQRDLVTMRAQQLRKVRGGQIGMVFQDPLSSLNPVLTIGTQLSEGLRAHLHLAGRDARARAQRLLQAVGIPDPRGCLGLYPHQLSGGISQRVMIAIAIGCNPRSSSRTNRRARST